ncbi:hypothetical protein LTS08_004447 [Lithohypha guttulata]|nr:hypothetical protein LTS08_004447 [Lithohypha guttulata]
MAKSKSTFGALVPLIVTVILLAVVAVVGFLAYQIAVDVADKTSKKMEKKNVSLSKDGLKVGVKEVSAEQIGDSTQSENMEQRLEQYAWLASGLTTHRQAKSVSTTTGLTFRH